MRVLFLNQYFPPDAAPTGILFAEVADLFREAGWEVEFLSAAQDYRASHSKRGGNRLLRELQSLAGMTWRALTARRPDVVVSGTSPPCLAFGAGVVALLKRAAHVHWVMDLYPEIAVALGEIRPGFLANVTGFCMGWSYRAARRVIALDSDMADRLRSHGVDADIIGPWVFHAPATNVLQPDPGRWTWIYSGNLGRAHEWETLLEAQREIEARAPHIWLIFQGSGPSWGRAREKAAQIGLTRVEWCDYVPSSELGNTLLRCHALVVTQREEARGLLWPSKLGYVLSLPRPILFVGPTNGAVARHLADYPHAQVFAPGSATSLASRILELASGPPLEVPEEARFDSAAHREAMRGRWRNLIAKLSLTE